MTIVERSPGSVQSLLEVRARLSITNTERLSLVYTPGVGRIATRIAAHPADARALTGVANRVAVVAASDHDRTVDMPQQRRRVEGHAYLMHVLGGLDAFPVLAETTDQLQLGDTLAAISPSFGGIVLTGTTAGEWHAFERQLQARVAIPVFDKDRHATALVAFAALDNALALAGKTIVSARVVIAGTGSVAGAVARLLVMSGIRELRVWDPAGRVGRLKQEELLPFEERLARQLASASHYAALSGALSGADVLIHTVPGCPVTTTDLGAMAAEPIVLALSTLHDASTDTLASTTATVATTDPRLPNFLDVEPLTAGLMRAALAGGATSISSTMRLAALGALARVVHNAETADAITPEPLDQRVVHAVENAVQRVLQGTANGSKSERIVVP